MTLNKRNIAAFFLSCYLIVSGRIRKIRKRAAKAEFILSVYFHDPSKELFEFTVKWFLKKGFHFISVSELEAIATGKKPFPSSAVLFTVDDGWKDNKENIVTVANKYNVPVTIFTSTDPIATGDAYWWSYIARANESGLLDRSVTSLKKVTNEERLKIVEEAKAKITLGRESLTVEQLQDISNSPFISIGSHTVTHPILPACPDKQSLFEIAESKKILENWLKKDVCYFAYPNGEFTEREVKFLKDAGYEMAFTTNAQYITTANFTNLYTLPRFDVLEEVSFTENICRMTGAWFDKPFMQKDK